MEERKPERMQRGGHGKRNLRGGFTVDRSSSREQEEHRKPQKDAKYGKKQEEGRKPQKDVQKCFNCQEEGHMSRQCPQPKKGGNKKDKEEKPKQAHQGDDDDDFWAPKLREPVDEPSQDKKKKKEREAQQEDEPRDQAKPRGERTLRGGHGNRDQRKKSPKKDENIKKRLKEEDFVQQRILDPKQIVQKAKGEYEQCLICTEDIVFYAIGECGHNQICWSCTLRQRLKLQNNTCGFCRVPIEKVLISSNKHDTLENNDNALCDPAYDLYFEDVKCKAFVLQNIGFFCKLCKEKARKFPTQEALDAHLDQMHHVHHCEICVKYKPVLPFEQEVYKFFKKNKHLKENHPECQFCEGKRFYDQDQLNRHYRDMHYHCDVCKRNGKKSINKITKQPEFKVYEDLEQYRKHLKSRHYVCRKNECMDLAFSDPAQLASHYLHVHNEQREIQIEFKEDSEEDEQNRDDYHQRKAYNKQQEKLKKQEEEAKNYKYDDYYDEEEPYSKEVSNPKVVSHSGRPKGSMGVQPQMNNISNQSGAAAMLALRGDDQLAQMLPNDVEKAYRQMDNAQMKSDFPSLVKNAGQNQKKNKGLEQAIIMGSMAGNTKKSNKPVRFSDNAREIAMQQNRLEKQKMLEKLGMQHNIAMKPVAQYVPQARREKMEQNDLSEFQVVKEAPQYSAKTKFSGLSKIHEPEIKQYSTFESQQLVGKGNGVTVQKLGKGKKKGGGVVICEPEHVNGHDFDGGFQFQPDIPKAQAIQKRSKNEIPVVIEEEKFEDQSHLMDFALLQSMQAAQGTKVDDSTLITKKGGPKRKKGRGGQKGVEVNLNDLNLPKQGIDFNRVFYQ